MSISRLRLKFFQLSDIKSNHLFILKSTHFQFGIDLTNFESKIGAEDQFWEESPISNINPSNQHPHQVTVMKQPNILLLPVIIALVPTNTLLIPQIL